MGSANYQIAISQGMIEGEGRYANVTPHHAGDSFAYTNMYSPRRERLLSLIIDGEYTNDMGDIEHPSEPLSATVSIRERYQVISDSAEADYEAAYSAKTVRVWLLREVGNTTQEVALDDQGGYEITSDGWDDVRRDGDEWVATYYSAEISR